MWAQGHLIILNQGWIYYEGECKDHINGFKIKDKTLQISGLVPSPLLPGACPFAFSFGVFMEGLSSTVLAVAEGKSPQLLERGPSIWTARPQIQEELGFLGPDSVCSVRKLEPRESCPGHTKGQGRKLCLTPNALAPKPGMGQAPLTQSIKGWHQANIHPVFKVRGHQAEL